MTDQPTAAPPTADQPTAAPPTEDGYLDGNAAAGPLRDVFSMDLTAAIGTCAGCGQRGPLGRVRVYVHAPGIVARCPGCDAVLMRLVQDPGPGGRTWLDLHGLALLQVTPGG